MANDSTTATDDESLAIRMMCSDKEALREVLLEHLQPTKDILSRKYISTLQACEIEEAIYVAAMKLWNSAAEYDQSKGSMGAWFFTMAQSAAIDIIRREKRYHTRNRPFGSAHEPAVDCKTAVDSEPQTKEEKPQLKDLDYIIENKLEGLQKAIIKADLAAGGLADAGRLAEKHSTSKNTIYVSRSKAHERIRKDMLELKQHRDRFRGKT